MTSAFLKLKTLANSIIGTRTGAESKNESLRDLGSDKKVLAKNNAELYEELLKQFPDKAAPKQHDEKQLHKLSSFTIF